MTVSELRAALADFDGNLEVGYVQSDDWLGDITSASLSDEWWVTKVVLCG